MKVFIVEDEFVIREGMKKKIPWEQEGMELAGDAADGELAYPLIKKTKPDILITDIKMPFMDGLELSRMVKKDLPDIKIIVLSGYNEFEYAKTAIQIGVTEYLLKPVNSTKLLETLKRVAQMIEKEQQARERKEEVEKEMQEVQEMERQKLFQKLVMKRMPLAEILDSASRLEVDLTASCYSVLLLKLNHDFEDAELEKRVCQAETEINRLIGGDPQILSFERGLEGWINLLKGDDVSELEEKMEKLRRDLLDIMKSYSQISFFGGMGTVVQRLRDVRKSYQEANRAFAHRFFLKSNQIIKAGEEPTEIHTEKETMDIQSFARVKPNQKQMQSFLKQGTLDDIDPFVEEYFEKVGENNSNSLIFRQYVLVDMMMDVSWFLDECGLNAKEIPKEIKDVSKISEEVVSIEKVKAFSRHLLEEAIRIRNSQLRKANSSWLEKAKDYMNIHFNENTLSLQSVAEQVNMSPNYFSSAFRQEYGQTFVEYLTSLRMEKAKEMLRCTNKRTQEIAMEIGYGDSHYFSNIFKKLQGCSPKEYRLKGKEEEI